MQSNSRGRERRRFKRRRSRGVVRSLIAVALAIVGAATMGAETAQILRWDDVSKAAVRIEQVTPTIAAGGAPVEGGYRILADAGIRSVIDLRTAAEGTEAARERAQAAGLRYFNLPMNGDPPSQPMVTRFAQLLADPDVQPLYFHCRSGNRAGTLWAIYRRIGGVNLDQAIAEGRAIGMHDERVAQVRNYPIETH